jgi:hypothetical protein
MSLTKFYPQKHEMDVQWQNDSSTTNTNRRCIHIQFSNACRRIVGAEMTPCAVFFGTEMTPSYG